MQLNSIEGTPMTASEKIKKIPVEEFTSVNPITVNASSLINEVKNLMIENNFRHMPVMENGEVVGILSDRDIAIAHRFDPNFKLQAKDLMTTHPYTVNVSDSIEEVVFNMSKNKIGSAIVLDDSGQIYGIFTSTDALNALVEIIRGVV